MPLRSHDLPDIQGRFVKTCVGIFVSQALAAFLAAQAPPAPASVEIVPDVPQALITNGVAQARLYLPDAEKGYYRATRFDWSGVIASVRSQGHTYFGQWFEKYDPKINDAIMGPVEEFGTTALGFDEAAPGGVFVKVGVGALKKPAGGQPYNHSTTYEIADPGKWSVQRGTDFASFTQELPNAAGYAYLYTKTVRLDKSRPILTLEHTLKNTGQKTIETSVYDHDFFMLDNQTTGPDVYVTFPFEVHWIGLETPLVETAGKELHFTRELQRGQTASSLLAGYGMSARDYDFRVENRKTGAGVRQTSDHPIARLNFWSTSATVCPEAYIDLKVEPGQSASWRISYEFYALPPPPK